MNKPVKTTSFLHHTKKTTLSKSELIKSIEDLGGSTFGFQNFIQSKISKYGSVVGLQSIKDFWVKDRGIVASWLFMAQCYIDYLKAKQEKENEQ